jgi:hypothetical protein
LLALDTGEIYRVGFDDAIALLEAWLKWSRRCRLEPLVKLARTITEQRPGSRPRFSTDCRTPGSNK